VSCSFLTISILSDDMAAAVDGLCDVEEMKEDVRGSILMRGCGEYGPFVHADPSPVHMVEEKWRPPPAYGAINGYLFLSLLLTLICHLAFI
jgi:hypothetical protein